MKTLAPRTRADNARFFDHPDDVPRHALTQGIGTILEARHIVVVAFGSAKAEAVAGCCEGPVTAGCPASALQLSSSSAVRTFSGIGVGRWEFGTLLMIPMIIFTLTAIDTAGNESEHSAEVSKPVY